MAPVVPHHLLPHRLLLVDDDPVLLETLTTLLQHEGFDVTTAESGEGAIRHLLNSQPPFDLVITDLVMPGKSGMDVLKQALLCHSHCTVLIMSGFASVGEATEAMEQGAYGLVTKPLHLDQFRNVLHRILERTELIQSRQLLQVQVTQLKAKVDQLEATRGRMEMLANQMNAVGDGSAGALADLERLANLKERGMLTSEQFEAAKKALLARWLP